MSDWKSVRARLRDVVEGKPYEGTYCVTNLRADIRAALQGVSELERERDEAVIHLGHYGRDVVRENAALRHRVEAAERETERWRHGVPVEGDYVCPDSQRAEAAEAKLKDVQDQMADIAASNADHVRWHREMEAKLAEAQDEIRGLRAWEAAAAINANAAKAHKAEVARLEGLILAWHDTACEHGTFFGVATAVMDEARRIRAQREEGK